MVGSTAAYPCASWGCLDYVTSMQQSIATCGASASDSWWIWTTSAFGKVNLAVPGCIVGAEDVTGDLPQPPTGLHPELDPWIQGFATDGINLLVGIGGPVSGGHVWWRDFSTGRSTWSSISGPGSGLPNDPVSALSMVLNHSGGTDVYAGLASGGVYVCRGCVFSSPHWSLVGSGLPNAGIAHLSFSAGAGGVGLTSTLFAWTYGRGVWSVTVG